MLPVRAVEGEIVAALARANRLVLTAPTGSGKTTQVPQMLLAHAAVAGRIVVLQPRRLAARLVAQRVAEELGTPLGQLVGYQTRHERLVSDATRLIFMTDGLLLRQMQGDPSLHGVGAVVLDEFHERSLACDLVLGLVRRLQEAQRPDLRLVVMSATLATAGVAAYMGCGAIEAQGRLYPVQVQHLPVRSPKPTWVLAAAALRQVLDEGGDGDVLVFMPGAYEIRRTVEACRQALRADERVTLRPLHGSLSAAEQDAALAPSSDGGRKVVIATNIAETSITIPGVRHVIDSGLARVHRYDPRRGINVLQTGPISQASATQRTGRAGRTAPGTCRRLWPQREHSGRPTHDLPEIRRLDLAEPMLQLSDLDVADITAFPWLDAPDGPAVERARRQLRMLGAIDEAGRLTDIGRRMAHFPMHPRLSRMLLEAAKRRCLGRAITWAALASERDIAGGAVSVTGEDDAMSDLAVRERAFEEAGRAHFEAGVCRRLGVEATACRELDRTRRLIERVARREHFPVDDGGTTADLIKCLLVAFPDHVATCADLQTRRCQMPGRKRVTLDRDSVIRQPGLILALDVQETARGGEAGIMLAMCSQLQREWLGEVHPHLLRQAVTVEWSDEHERVEEIESLCFDELVLEQTRRPASASEAATDVLVARIRQGQLQLDRWDEKVEQWIARTRCVAQWMPERKLLAYDDQDVAVILHEIVATAVSAAQARSRPVLDAVRNALSWEDQQIVDKLAPEQIILPSGRPLKLTYQPGQPPRGRAKIQELYGLQHTPRVAAGRVTVLLEILGPNHRPVQVTDDLANFWQTLYPRLKSELQRRYPRHEWR